MAIELPALETILNPARSALLLIDIQAHVIDNPRYVGHAPAALANLKRVLTQARETGVRIIHTRVVESDATDTPVWTSRHRLKAFRVGARREGTSGAEFHPDFGPEPGEIEMIKRRYSCFLGTNLDGLLRAGGIDTLVMAGIATNICLETTAVDAFQRNLWTVILGDCSATHSQEEHEVTLREAAGNWGMVIDADAAIAAWRTYAQ